MPTPIPPNRPQGKTFRPYTDQLTPGSEKAKADALVGLRRGVAHLGERLAVTPRGDFIVVSARFGTRRARALDLVVMARPSVRVAGFRDSEV